MHGLGTEKYIVSAIFYLCADNPLNYILSDNFRIDSKNFESLKHESILFKF